MLREREPLSLHDAIGRLLPGHEHATLTNALRVAAERFDADAEAIRADAHKLIWWALAVPADELAGRIARLMIQPRAYPMLIGQFERQAAETRALLNRVEGYDEDEDDDAA